MKKYELLLHDTIDIDGFQLYRIRALIDIPSYNVKAGDLGGYIQSEKNLCHADDCWVEGAYVYNEASINDSAYVKGNGRLYISNGATLDGLARVQSKSSRSCFISDPVNIGDDALIKGSSSYLYVSLSYYYNYTFYKTASGYINYNSGADTGTLEEFKEKEGRESFKDKVIINYIFSLVETYFHKSTFLLEG